MVTTISWFLVVLSMMNLETLDVKNLSQGWQHGLPDDPYFGLPRGLIGHTIVELPTQSLILVGGAYFEENFFESSDEILKLDFFQGKPTWVELNRLGGHGRYSTVAMLVPDDGTLCNFITLITLCQKSHCPKSKP